MAAIPAVTRAERVSTWRNDGVLAIDSVGKRDDRRVVFVSMAAAAVAVCNVGMAWRDGGAKAGVAA